MYYHTHYSCVMYSPNVQLLIHTLLSMLGILTKQMMKHKVSCRSTTKHAQKKKRKKNMINKYTSDNNNCSTSLLNHELMYYTTSLKDKFHYS